MDKHVWEQFKFPSPAGASLTSAALPSYKNVYTNIMSVASGTKLLFTLLALAYESQT